MRSQQAAKKSKYFEFSGYSAIESPGGNLTIPSLELSFGDRGCDESNQARNLMLSYLLNPKVGKVWGNEKTDLLREYSENSLTLAHHWFEFYNWRITAGVLPEDKEESWVLGSKSGNSLEITYPHKWISFWEGLIVRGFTPSILEAACIKGFPVSPPTMGCGKILYTATGDWKYIWKENSSTDTIIKGKKLSHKSWGPETIETDYASIFEEGFENEVILMEYPNFRIQVEDKKRGWLDDWSFHTMAKAQAYIVDEKLVNSRVINNQSGQEVNLLV